MKQLNRTIFPDLPEFRIHSWDGDVMVMQITDSVRIRTSEGTVLIPAGFTTDGLSIPRFAWPIVGPSTGAAFLAGLLHDFLYSKASNGVFDVTRAKADALFLEAMGHLKIGPQRFAIWAAVRAFGWKFYKR